MSLLFLDSIDHVVYIQLIMSSCSWNPLILTAQVLNQIIGKGFFSRYFHAQNVSLVTAIQSTFDYEFENKMNPGINAGQGFGEVLYYHQLNA